MKKIHIFFYFLIILCSINILHSKNIVELKAIDRVTGRTYNLKAPVNEESNFSILQITPKVCYKSPPDKQPESSAYIVIKEKNKEGNIFEGWMFASSPSLNSLEHPVYDVWLLSCKINKD